jgi:hypothetical protein
MCIIPENIPNITSHVVWWRHISLSSVRNLRSCVFLCKTITFTLWPAKSCSATLSLNLARNGVSGRRHTHFIGGWICPRAGQEKCGICFPHQDSSPGSCNYVLCTSMYIRKVNVSKDLLDGAKNFMHYI